jgi:hypothetical protein
LKKRVVLAGLLAPAIFACALASARAGETTVGLTLNATIGTHSEGANDTETLPLVPAPIFSIEHTQGRFSVFLEGLPPIGPVAFSDPGPAHATGTKLSLFDGALRYTLPGTRLWVGLGATLINQATSYHTVYVEPIPGSYTITEIYDRVDASRLAGARFEAGANLWTDGRQRVDVSVATSPRMHTLIRATGTENYSSTNPNMPPASYGLSESDAETASLLDAQARWSFLRGRSTWTVGLRYINHAATFDYDGSEADRNRLVLPFVGWSTRL